MCVCVGERGMGGVGGVCPQCGRAEENELHLFFRCNWQSKYGGGGERYERCSGGYLYILIFNIYLCIMFDKCM